MATLPVAKYAHEIAEFVSSLRRLEVVGIDHRPIGETEAVSIAARPGAAM